MCTHGFGTLGFLVNTGYLLFSFPFPILLPFLIKGLGLIAHIPGVPIVVRFGVVFGAPSTLFCAWGSPTGNRLGPALVARCRRCRRRVGLVAVVRLHSDVHEPLVQLPIGEVVLGHEIVLDVGHGWWEGLEEVCGLGLWGAKDALGVVV